MLGYIHYVLVNTVRELGGDDAVEAVAQQAGLETMPDFRIDSNYDDKECLALIGATGEYFGLDEKALCALYADRFIEASKQQFPLFYQLSSSTRDFLYRQPRIHSTFAASIADASTRKGVGSKFEMHEHDGGLRVIYRSPNALCALYEALFYRLLKEYGESGRLIHKRCAHKGDSHCEFQLYFDQDPS
ncbi:heme NO-binding domain-containing protein [Gallaecimonas mangrovi]|uniref:heme NO-binding domain-containing protein n=1 Tax=Gallaecimonas mangrovi TaxID=2291597 RepID=UPI000E206443|nr:heme NO-binding domain-containing protein [Gallaecimonas mangrovi]